MSNSFDNQSILKINQEYYNNLDIEGFSLMMKDPSYCYKFYWLEAIVKLISQDVKTTTFNDIIDEMICNAWYTVLEFHVHLSGMMEPLLDEIISGEPEADISVELNLCKKLVVNDTLTV